MNLSTRNRAVAAALRAVSIGSLVALSAVAQAAIDGTDLKAIDGTDAQAITAGGAESITGTGLRSITGTGIYSITGTGAASITGTGLDSITGTGLDSITGTGLESITGTGSRAIDGTDAQAITAGGAELLVVGPVNVRQDGFMAVLGQSVFGAPSAFAGFRPGDTVAVYGDLDPVTGGIVNATVARATNYGWSYLRGIVDAVDPATGRAVVSGVTVDYTALLANGVAPSVGDEVAVSGYAFNDANLLVAQP